MELTALVKVNFESTIVKKVIMISYEFKKVIKLWICQRRLKSLSRFPVAYHFLEFRIRVESDLPTGVNLGQIFDHRIGV